jgi:hypothetical protein
MIRSSLRRWSSDRILLRDGIAILLALAIGIGGLIFVFSIPNPFTGLAPLTPLLTPQDWPGSYASIAMGTSTEGPWREKRGFNTDLELHADTYGAGISQIAIWYADPMEAAAHWMALDRVSYKEEPFVTSAGGDGTPASMLFCGTGSDNLPEGFRGCWYLVYWEHWFSEVNYRSTLDEDLHMLEMQKIAARVDQLLMSAPAEPCYGVLCTNTKKEIKP